MDPKLKTALAVVIGIVIGMTMLGSAIALPAAFHAVASRTSAGQGFGPMGERQGMMGRGQGGPQWDGDQGACPNGGQGRGGMRGRGQFGPQDGSQMRPNGVDPSACPGCTEAPTTES